jgi:carbon monoxide dehydrogenase subunit G
MQTWKTEHSIEITAAPQAIWAAFRDVASWKRWNAGVEDVALEGPFAAGTWFTMKPAGQDALRSRLVEVRENERFVDETAVGDLVVTVAHRIEALPSGLTRVTYAVEAKGPGAEEVGPMVSSDFPEVLASLSRWVKS